MSLRCVLAFPCPRKYREEPGVNLLPLGLLTIGASLARKGHRVTVAHLMRMTKRDALSLALDSDLLGLSCFTFQRAEVFDFAKKVKERSSNKRPFVVVGGPHATPLAEEILAH